MFSRVLEGLARARAISELPEVGITLRAAAIGAVTFLTPLSPLAKTANIIAHGIFFHWGMKNSSLSRSRVGAGIMGAWGPCLPVADRLIMGGYFSGFKFFKIGEAVAGVATVLSSYHMMRAGQILRGITQPPHDQTV